MLKRRINLIFLLIHCQVKKLEFNFLHGKAFIYIKNNCSRAETLCYLCATNQVHKTGAYFNAMINRAQEGELHLHNSVFGILKKEYGQEEAA
jgi:hypothetical protein